MPKLYLFHARNACSLASVVALEAAQLPYEMEIVDLASERTEYRKRVPSGRVPALFIDDELLVQSPAILFRIADMAPMAGLLPTSLAGRSQLLSFLSWCSSSMHIARRRLRRPHHFTSDLAAQAMIARDALAPVLANLQLLEARAKASPWLAADHFTVADASALVFYGWAILDGIDLENFPCLRRWADAAVAHPPVLRALSADKSPILTIHPVIAHQVMAATGGLTS